MTLAYHQGIIFRKLKMNNKFTSAVTEFKISKKTINFKKDIVKFIEKYSKMRTSCISLFYLKKYFRIIREVCHKHVNEFQ